jgi:hypothetical protein
MASLLWTIVPLVVTFSVAAWTPQTGQPQSTAASKPNHSYLNPWLC